MESEKCASFGAAMKCGAPVYTKAESTLADGLAVPTVGVNAYATASSLVDKVRNYCAEICVVNTLSDKSEKNYANLLGNKRDT